MRHGLKALALVGLLVPAASNAALIFYGDETAFRAAVHQERYRLASEEKFQKGKVGEGGIAAFDGPLNSSTDNAVYQPGDVVDGVTISSLARTSFVDQGAPLVALGSGLAGIPSKALGISNPTGEIGTDKVSIWFDEPQRFVSFNFTSIDFRSNTYLWAAFDLDIYVDGTDELSRLGGAVFGSIGTDPLGFLGISSDTPFTRLVLVTLTAYASPVIDNLAFNAKPIPEPGTLGLLALGLLGLGFTARRKAN